MSTAPASRLTALDALHRSLGATMTDFAGWDMPLRYASERDEHHAVRDRAGLFDLSHMGEITVTGPQAVDFLNHALVGNIATIGRGRARYTMIVAEDGGILDDLIVYRLGAAETPSTWSSPTRATRSWSWTRSSSVSGPSTPRCGTTATRTRCSPSRAPSPPPY